MEFAVENIDDIAVVGIRSDVIDAANAKEFREDITPVLDKNKKVIFDMSQVGFLDSSGCGMILSCLRQLGSEGGNLKMFALQKPVLTLFELIRMHRIIEIFNTREEALKSF